ncbi:MAG: hypothetical protein K5793_04225 [Nitrosarchaeum sp.]|nr:hypothetical protein [Nitrosarchaeum sp.]
MTKNKKIKERREKVLEYLLNGYTEEKISDIFKVSQKTISRDIQILKLESVKYIRVFPIQEYLFLYKLSVDKLQNYEIQLNQLKENTTTENKIKIIRELQKNIELQVKMLASPMLYTVKSLLEYFEGKLTTSMEVKGEFSNFSLQKIQNLS